MAAKEARQIEKKKSIMDDHAVLDTTERKETFLSPSQKFFRDLLHVLRKIKAAFLYHVDYHVSETFQDSRFSHFRFPMIPYHFDQEICYDFLYHAPPTKIFEDGIQLPYNIEMMSLLRWAHLGCIVQFGIMDKGESKRYDWCEFTKIKDKKFQTIWIRINSDLFNEMYAEYERTGDPFQMDAKLRSTYISQEPEAKDEKLILFKATPEYRDVIVEGRQYSLTARRAEAFKLIHEYYQKGILPVHQSEILEKLSDPVHSETLRDLFKGSPLWNSVLVPVGGGRITMRLPENPQLPKFSLKTPLSP